MASRLEDIETKMLTMISSIDGTDQGTYIYNSITGQVQIYDEALSLSRNTDNKMVNHIVEQLEDEGVFNAEFEAGQYAYTQKVIYKITSKVHNTGAESNAKNAIRNRMSEVLDDLLYLFGNNHTMSGIVSYIKFNNGIKEYSDISNNRIQSASLVSTWEVTYTQSMANPRDKACA